MLGDHRRHVTPVATEDAATLLAQRGRVALPTFRPEGAEGGVGGAERRRVLGVDEVELAGRLDGLAVRYEALAVVAGDHLGCAVEALLESVADVPEVRHLPPTGAQRAGSRETVAFAFCAHVVLYCLEGRNNMGFKFY